MDIKSPKIHIFCLIIVLAALSLTAGNISGKSTVLTIGIIAAISMQLALWGKVTYQMLLSAAITGAIAGALSAPSGDTTFVFCASCGAIASKRFLRLKGHHIFNPATFGLLSTSLILSNRINWWGGSSQPLIVAAAGLILLRMKRLAMPFAYIATRVLTAYLAGLPFESAMMLPNLFFAFIMLVEPKTSPGRQKEQWIFGAGCGIISTLIYQTSGTLEGDLAALLIVNLLYRISKLLPAKIKQSAPLQTAQ